MKIMNNSKGIFNFYLAELLSCLKKEFSCWGGICRILVFIIILVSFLCMALVCTLRCMKNSGLHIIKADGTTISIGYNTKIQQYLIDPRQPNATNIELKKGDSVRVSISGSVHVAMGRMIRALQYEYAIKDSLFRAIHKRHIRYFTPEQRIRSRIAYPWTGPKGIDTNSINDTNVRNSIRESDSCRVLPGARPGQLIAFISEKRDKYMFDASDTTDVHKFNGETIEFKATHKGYLWFIINDDAYVEGNILSDITWQDNLGFFYATITID
jgi:hypothetical protein